MHLQKFSETQSSTLTFDLVDKEVIGIGKDGIVIALPIQGLVFKVGKTRESAELLLSEYKKHDSFYRALNDGRVKGVIPDYIKVPKIFKSPVEYGGFYGMEYIQGITLNTLYLQSKYKSLLEGLSNQKLSNHETKEFLRQHGISEDEILGNTRMWQDYLSFPIKSRLKDSLRGRANDFYNGISSTLDFIKQNYGFEHSDLHGDNVILGDDGNIYIIDFGRLEVDSFN